MGLKLMPQAEIVADRFHVRNAPPLSCWNRIPAGSEVMKQVNDEIDRARRKAKREATKIKNNQAEREALAYSFV